MIGSFILMRQSRLSLRQDERNHLMMQVLFLTEKETTALLNITRQIAPQIGLEKAANSTEIRELARHTSIEAVAQTIKETLAEVQMEVGGEPKESLD